MRGLILTICLIPSALLAQSSIAKVDSQQIVPPHYEVITFDDTGAMSNYIRYDYDLSNEYYVILNVADSEILGQSRPRIPDQFVQKVKVDSSMYVVDYNYDKNGNYDVIYPDSIDVIDYAAADSFLLKDPKFHYDTIRVKSREVLKDIYPFNYHFTNVCGYYYQQKHGYEMAYYKLDELKGIIITGPNYQLKYTGSWKRGQKNGKWKYYTPDGELSRTEKWKKGRLKKTRLQH